MFGAAVVSFSQPSTELALETIDEPYITETSEETQPVVSSTEERVREYFDDIPILVDVARCESQFRQFNSNGTVLRGIQNPDDVGVMQLNEYYHKAQAVKLGHDIHTLEGNMAYARYLYEKEGTAPWVYSSPCWGKTREVALR